MEWSKIKEVKVGSSLIMTYERRDISFFFLERGGDHGNGRGSFIEGCAREV